MNDLISAFGLAVRARRESLGWSQEELAAQAGLNRSYVGEIERAQVIPSLATVEKLAQALEVPPSQLVSGAEDRLLHANRLRI